MLRVYLTFSAAYCKQTKYILKYVISLFLAMPAALNSVFRLK